MGKLSPGEILDFRKTIGDYFREDGRSFPWRETKDPYRILVSEIMLQQTQTDRVVPKYLAWLEAFPDAASLAGAPFSSVLQLWVGLGYNRRARYLQEACKAVLERFGGVFPSDPESLETLPGIGHYTARAVSTFAFGKPNVFIETNIRAVYIFFFFPGREEVSDAEILELVGETVDETDSRSWYYALMDYGADLKRKVKNPNRQSRHYTRQSKFEGSPRQARGAIVRHLAAQGSSKLEDIALAESIPYERLASAARRLVDEGLVCETDGVYRIS